MPQTTKTFRVFVSSTFTDMREERRILQKDVFPRLKTLCESKGATFQDVDLRWGVNEDAQLDQRTMDICLGEIDRCQKLSPKPNFIILLGDKYGWQPIPARIPSVEMGSILKQCDEEEKSLLKRWYKEDLNAVPPEYVLQPREGEFRDYKTWEPLEIKLRITLRNAAGKLPFTEEQKIKYFTSATHQEIIRGALNQSSGSAPPEEHVFAYLRTMRNMPEDSMAHEFIDLCGDARDEYSKTQLEYLKKALTGDEKQKGLLPKEHVYNYQADWNKGCVLDDAKAFGVQVYEHLASIMKGPLAEIGDVDPLVEENSRHEVFKKQRLEHFTGMTEALTAISDYLNSNSDKVLSIIGESGTGKTSLLAKAIAQADSRPNVKVFRFCGTTTATSDTFSLLSGLIRSIVNDYGVEVNALLNEGEDETKFSTLRGMQDILPRCLSLAREDKPLLIILDALDQLTQDSKTLSVEWLPDNLPEHVKFIVSALPELREKLARTIVYHLGDMPTDDGRKLLGKWLEASDRTLTNDQMQLVMERFDRNKTPLYLRLAFEKARSWHSYDTNVLLQSSIDGVLAEYFENIENNHDKLLVQKICGYLLSGKYRGLMEQEVLDLLVEDEKYWNHFLEQCHKEHVQEVKGLGKLPLVVWSRLFLDLEPYLTVRDADGLSILSFYHRKFTEFALHRYLTDALPFHIQSAEYFEKLPLYLDDEEKRPNVRKVVEQPYQQTLAEKWTDVREQILADFPFLMAKAKADMTEGILEDYVLFWDKAPQQDKDNLRLWRAFFTERAHILRRADKEWPAYKILLQLAVEHADNSPLTIAAEKYLGGGKVDWVWLRRMQKAKEAGFDPCLSVLEGHNDIIYRAMQLSDKRILSWSKDNTLRIWDNDGRPCAVLEGHTNWISGALQLNDKRILSWSGDNTLRIWDNDGRPCAVLEGHTSGVSGALQLNDKRILSWSGDNTLRIWDSDGRPCAVLEGHTSGVSGALKLFGGRILSWSEDFFDKDNTLRIWDSLGRSFAVLKAHIRTVRGALQLFDGRILSWSKDKTMRVWNTEGCPLAILTGHTEAVFGTLQLSDGCILSWAGDTGGHDCTLRIWATDGSPIAVLVGHTCPVVGALQLSDKRILSWSGDNTLRIWDNDRRPCAVLEGHTDLVYRALQLSDKRILSWSKDNTLRIWDSDGRPCAVLEGHTGIRGAIELNTGQILSWSGDKTLHIWNADGIDGQSNAVPERHTASVNGAIELNDGLILSWSRDNTLRTWATDGRSLAVLKGHKYPVLGALQLNDGRILSWSIDSTLRLWNTLGQFFAVLDGHTYTVSGALQLNDGRILSWAGDYWGQDNTLRIWNTDGCSLAVLKGHKYPVLGALQLNDGRILSWSWDGVMHIWDTDGCPLAILKAHTKEVKGALQLNDGRILSWSGDNTLRIWDNDGRPLAILLGHADWINGAAQITDERILSWSQDKTLYIWDSISGTLANAMNFKQFCIQHPELIPRYLGNNICRTDCFSVAEGSYADVNLCIKGQQIILCARWQAESDCTARFLRAGGTFILTQANGQVCFPMLYSGANRISLDELLSHYDYSAPENDGPEKPQSVKETKQAYQKILREGLEYHRDHKGLNVECHHGHLCALIAHLEKEGRFDEARKLEAERDEIAKLLKNLIPSEDPAELRREALSFFKEGAYDEAERNLRLLLDANFDVPGTHCHLARVLLMQDKLETAREEIRLAWELRNDAPAYSIPRILWFHIIFAILDGRTQSPYLGRLKTALNNDGAFMEWTMDPVLDHLKPKLTLEDHALLSALVAAMSDKQNLTALDQFPQWREAKAEPLDGG